MMFVTLDSLFFSVWIYVDEEVIMKKVGYLGFLLVGLGLLLAACSGPNTQADQKPEPVKYTIEMSEFAYAPNEIQARVGQDVTIELVNTGALEHELMIGRTVKMHDNRPDGFEQDMFETAHVKPEVMGGMEGEMDMDSEGMSDEHTGFMVSIANGGENAMITFTANQEMVGEWEMGCFEQDGVHYDAGMKGKLVIVP
jgi:plastocyanin